MRRVAVLAVSVVSVVVASVAASCGSDESADPAATASSSAPTDATPSTVADSVEETTAPTTATPTTAAPTTATPTTPTTATPTTAAPTTAPPSTAAPTTLPPFPPSLIDLPDPPDVWSVVLAGSADFDDPVLAQAVADAEAAGYFVGPTDCDEGAAEAIGMAGNGVYTITVYLNSETDARAAADAFAARGVDATVALIRLFCLD